MGYGPDQVDQWAPYQVLTVYRSWLRANSPSTGPKAPSDEEFRQAVSRSIH